MLHSVVLLRLLGYEQKRKELGEIIMITHIYLTIDLWIRKFRENYYELDLQGVLYYIITVET